MFTRRIAAWATAVVAAGALTACGGDRWESKCTTNADLVIERAPDQRPEARAVTGELLDGGTYDVAQDRGKIVVVNFWGSWCNPCRAEADDLEKTYQATKAKGVSFIGVDIRDDRDAAKAFERGRVTYPSIFDADGRVALKFDVTQVGTPSTLILDRKGRIAAAMRRPVVATELQPLVERLAAEGDRLMGATFADVVGNGPLLLAIGAAALAGLVSFLSPCVLPLMPGYLSYVTGLAGSDLDDAGTQTTAVEADAGGVAVAAPPARRVRGRILAGTSLFVLGFAVVFTLLATLVANLGTVLLTHKRVLDVVLGVLVIGFGLAFLGLVPGLQREVRIRRLPQAGLLGAPIFGALFGLSWMPCVGPTLAAVLGLATRTGQTDRAVVLAVAYSLGLGVPFVLFGLFFRKLLGVFRAVRRNSRWVTRVGGGLLIVVGLVLVTGGWTDFLIWLQTTFDFDAGTLL